MHLVLACAALVALALLAPAVAQPPDAHAFADQRALFGIPHALDVLSNLPFAAAGAWGLVLLHRARLSQLHPTQRGCAQVFFIGLLVTAAGSSWYHLAPDDIGLAIDRGSMSVAFAGLLGLVAAGRVSDRAGRALCVGLLLAAPASVLFWLRTGNVLPWAVVQFGGIALVLLVLATGSQRLATLPVRWSLVLLAYAIAKLFEVNDHAVLAASGELLSGHTLKHVAAALAAAPVIVALLPLRRRQNGTGNVARAT
ncbi:hypothetical protein JJB11_07020 [Ramlibacter ginsenosidimutans]|uniref:Alkaline phytoceramidase n=2 Tax=Ramlibacter ginsenosidimutans TaxID=502333 RepID=A0A934TQY8_9BURK|nr:hypothetical protein [Ramlibacter ginsenosidimutans]MBK6005843.1 hypothetical protein [Ramlibacter ginsenosidimutans]